jgi:tetratricopeptide (TPR) repeat protein
MVVVTQTSPLPSLSVQTQVEALTAVAKKLSGEGREAQALEAYKTASGLMPGAPWLQHRTAELARRLRQPEAAALHYRRAAAAFISAGFPKRALGPLRTGWQVCIALLPGDAATFITIALELANVQRELGFAAEAKLTLTNSNQALRASGSSERVPSSVAFEVRATRPPPAAEGTQPPESGVKTAAASSSSNGFFSRLQAAVKP